MPEPNDENEDAGEAHHARVASDGASGSPGSVGTGGGDANPTGTVSEPTDSITTTSGRGTGTEPGSSGTSPGTPEPVATSIDALEAPAPTLGFDPEGDATVPDWARDDFEVERATRGQAPARVRRVQPRAAVDPDRSGLRRRAPVKRGDQKVDDTMRLRAIADK